MSIKQKLSPPIDRRVFTPLLAVIALLTMVDIAQDLTKDHSVREIASHVVILLAALVGLVVQWGKTAIAFYSSYLPRRATSLGLRSSHRVWQDEARHLSEELRQAVERQFERWQLTAAERDVALLLIKGWSVREIARQREVSELTIKHQCQSIYRKSGLDGRAELAAFFLEDLVKPFFARPKGATGADDW